MNQTVYCTLGRTASGKTTLSKYLSRKAGLLYISESRLKRAIVTQKKPYNANDSMNEELRNIGYKIAIEKCHDYLEHGSNPIIDASFHKRFRRQWLYEVITNYNCNLIILYTDCKNIKKIENRIRQRVSQKKNENNQADSLSVYHHIDQYFDEPIKSELTSLNAAIFFIDTDINIIQRFIAFNNSQRFNELLRITKNLLEKYLDYMNTLYAIYKE